MELDGGFKQKINYDYCLTSLACSIEKYFEVEPKHKTIPEVDKMLEEKKPENVILLLCDGLGSRIMNHVLKNDDFLMRKREREIFSVFPPTTASCLTSVKTGLNPSEHGWLGWNVYVQPLNKIIALFKDKVKGTKRPYKDFVKMKKQFFRYKTITDLINEKKKYSAFETTCYPYNVEKKIDNVFLKVLEILKQPGKKYIFAYYPEPDEILHKRGVTSMEARKEIEHINRKVEEYSKKILETKNTIMFITADHGHLIIPNQVELKNQEFLQYLQIPNTFIEDRNPAFLVKKGQEENFKASFLKEFGNDFYLLSREEILEKKVFGEYEEGKKHPLLDSLMGDFIAFSKDTSKIALLGEGDSKKTSFHGGYNDDEIYVPLIVISN